MENEPRIDTDTGDTRKSSETKLSKGILEILKVHGALSAKEMAVYVLQNNLTTAKKPDSQYLSVYTCLSRLCKVGKVVTIGERRQKKYSLPEE